MQNPFTTVTAQDSALVAIDGHRLRLTNLGKVLYPATGTTKADVLDYYARVADVLIPHSADRPLTRKRWVHGVGTDEQPGEMFFEKNLAAGAPDWVQRRSLAHSTRENVYPLLNDRATLAWLAQVAALELHVPQWRFSRAPAPGSAPRPNPDRIVFDLDPGPGVGLAECVQVALLVKAILDEMGLAALPVTSGSKGIHLYAALDARQDSDAVSAVAHELARALEADHPDLVVSDMKKSLRTGRVLLDWSQNNGNKTTIAPYSLRGRSHPTVAAPRTWEELLDPHLAQLGYLEVLARVEAGTDPLRYLAPVEPAPDDARDDAAHRDAAHRDAAPDDTAHEPAAADRLAKYRSMRDRSKTPEPVPAASASSSTPATPGRSFVIQEHHARRLHYDFRLEHDGVLVSWALPKGVPTDPAQNHLAVQTEDHPLEYGTFEGTIPAGEYGGGEVTIWDTGTYELEKWRDGKEIIATLHGEKHGTHRYALIHTGGRGGTAKDNWLIHLMKDDLRKDEAAADAPARAARARPTVGGSSRRRAPSIEPMLATAGAMSDLSDDDAWAFEMKWDGIRAVATVADRVAQLVSRNGIDLTAAYPDLELGASLPPGRLVLDGEIVALDRHGRPDFGRLQQRMNLEKPGEIAAAARATPVHFVIFDLLERGEESYLDDDYDSRRARLLGLVASRGRVQVPAAFDGDAASALASSRDLNLEGILAKRRDSTYTPGRRSRAWIKIKHVAAQEVVIGGWRPGKGRRANRVGSLLLGIPDERGLSYVGRVGTGFSERDLDRLTTRLAAMEQPTSPFADVPRAEASDARWVSPTLVGEVEFAEWTSTGRLRQPTWRGMRPDRAADDIERESP